MDTPTYLFQNVVNILNNDPDIQEQEIDNTIIKFVPYGDEVIIVPEFDEKISITYYIDNNPISGVIGVKDGVYYYELQQEKN